MRRTHKTAVAAMVGLAAIALSTAPSLAAGDHRATAAAAPEGPAPMAGSQGGQWSSQPCSMGMMMARMMESHMGGQTMMGPAMRPGMGGQGMMPGTMMGPGTMQSGMAGQRMMGPGMMGPGIAGQGMAAPGFEMGLGNQVVVSKDLTADDVRHFLVHQLEARGNKRLEVGAVNEADGDTIVAEITTVDGSLVQRLEIDRHTGKMQSAE